MIVKVWFPNNAAALQVRLNAETRAVLRQLSRSTGSYVVRNSEHIRALTPHIIR